MKKETPWKKYEQKKLEVIELFKTTNLNRVQIADKMGMTGADVGIIIAEDYTIKGDHTEDGKFRHPEGFTPCMVTLQEWPRCYGYGCYFVSADSSGMSVCQAYNAMQN